MRQALGLAQVLEEASHRRPHWLRGWRRLAGRLGRGRPAQRAQLLAVLLADLPDALHRGEVSANREDEQRNRERRPDAAANPERLQDQAGDDDYHPLRARQDAGVAGEAQALRPGPHITDEIRPRQRDQHDDRPEAVVVVQEIDQDAEVDHAFRITVYRRVEKGAVSIYLSRGP